MPLKHRLFSVFAASIFCLGLLCAALVWQTLSHGRQQQARTLLGLQVHAWQQLEAEQMALLERIATPWRDGHARATPQTLAQTMQAAVRSHPGLRIDLLGENAKLLATTSDDVSPEPLLDPVTLARWVEGQAPTQGLHQLSSRQYNWLQLTPVGQHMLVLGLDAAFVLPQLSQRQPGDFFLLNTRGTPVAGTADDDGLFSRILVPVRTPQVLTLAASDAQPALQLVSQPLVGANGMVIGSLAWRQNATAAVQQERQFTQRAALATVALLALLTGGMFLFVRHTLSPLTRSVQVLQALSRGDTETTLDGGEEDAEDESGTVARGVMQLRAELLNLETLRQERLRSRRQQERLIRDQLRSLASNLDPASRDEILATLGSQENAQATPSGEAPNVLADLASILGRMSGLVSTQQSRLLQLLREVQASVQTQAMLASLQQELEIARQMQLSILPSQTPDRREIDIASTMIPAKEVGGDFYDYFAIDDDHLAIVIADVSGKGVPAAFFMAISRTLLKSNALFLRTPGTTIAALNDQLCMENDQMMFVTVFYAVLQLSSGLLTFVNAGHNPPILLSQGTARYFPKGRNMALAVLESQQYHEGTLQLSAGDSLLLYTDGVTEATNAHNALFGDALLLQTVQSVSDQPQEGPQAQLLTERIVQEVRRFEAGAAQADDITVVAITYRGSTP
jgi:sigma-B regulation protein RsbU (phosphoserine phosphatase)